MSFYVGMIMGVTLGIGFIVAFARYEKVRSKRRSNLVYISIKFTFPLSIQSHLLPSCYTLFIIFFLQFFCVWNIAFGFDSIQILLSSCSFILISMLILGEGGGRIFKNDSGGFKKDSSR